MTMSANVRRCVGSALIATLTPWMTGCHHEVGVSMNAPAPFIGKTVRIKIASGTQANVVDFDGVRQVVSNVTQIEGVLMTSAVDSIRLSSVVLWRLDRSHSQYREAAIQVTGNVSATQTKLEPVRTTLVVTGVFAAVLLVAFVIAMANGIDELAKASGGHTVRP